MSSPNPSVRDALDGVCSLSDVSLEERLAWIGREILPHARTREVLPDGVRLAFPPDDALRAKLARWVELERACCSGPRFELEEGEGLELSVHGIDPHSPALASLGEAPAPRGGGLARLAQAGGVGFAAAFFVLCVLPVALAALAGAAVAAPLAGLESPATLAAGTLFAGAGAWWWLRRRSAARAGRRTGC